MKIVVIGTRGFPNVQGGVERYCEQLYPELVEKGHEVIVLARASYVEEKRYKYKGVEVIALDCPKNKYLETATHSKKAVVYAKKLKPDILHIHGIGPALYAPLARRSGMKVVVTVHSLNYEHDNWGWFAKRMLKKGEARACKYAHKVIAISEDIAESLRKKYRCKPEVIKNGVSVQEKPEDITTLLKYRVQSNKYILAVGRFVPEKRFQDLIDVFDALRGPWTLEGKEKGPFKDPEALPEGRQEKIHKEEWKLVIAGDADHEDDYSRKLKQSARDTYNVVLTGFLAGEDLEELYANAGLYVLPSSHEGLPISLLEAMSYGVSCIASDIPANRAVPFSEDRYFKPGNIPQLGEKIKHFIDHPISEAEKQSQIEYVRKNYSWEEIAEATIRVYQAA